MTVLLRRKQEIHPQIPPHDAKVGRIIRKQFIIPHNVMVDPTLPCGRLIRYLPSGVNAFNIFGGVETLVHGAGGGGKYGALFSAEDAAIGKGVDHRVVAVYGCLATVRDVAREDAGGLPALFLIHGRACFVRSDGARV